MFQNVQIERPSEQWHGGAQLKLLIFIITKKMIIQLMVQVFLIH